MKMSIKYKSVRSNERAFRKGEKKMKAERLAVERKKVEREITHGNWNRVPIRKRANIANKMEAVTGNGKKSEVSIEHS